ncbi:MAG: hypothetical protein KatS3mg004_3375 [Bryobacteraceae bacterium]|nr:MAG: hypothetical protein KatS3mg004_3375 [Bryobacteraceae bacterium]
MSVPNRAELVTALRERALRLLAEIAHADAVAERLMKLAEARWMVNTGGQVDAAEQGPTKAAGVRKAQRGKHRATTGRGATTVTASEEEDLGQTQGQQLEADLLDAQWREFKQGIAVLHQQIRRALKILSAGDPLRDRLERLSLCRGGGLRMDELREELELIVAMDSPGSGLPMKTSGNDPMQVEPAPEEEVYSAGDCRTPGGVPVG